MNTLTAIEAERVNHILRHGIERLTTLSYLPISWDDEIVEIITCVPVLNSLEKLWIAEKQLMDIDPTMRSNGLKDIAALKQVHRSAQAVCRNFFADTESRNSLEACPELQSPEFIKLIEYMDLLREQVMQRLTTTVEDEANNRSLLHDLTERERHYTESRDILQSKLNALLEESKSVSSQLETTNQKLNHELQEVTQQNADRLETVQKEMNDTITKGAHEHENRTRQLVDRVSALERQLNEAISWNRDEEQRMRREKVRMEVALNAKIAQYDEDMSNRKHQLDTLKECYERESAEYAILKEHFDKIDADLGRQSEEERILAEVKRRRNYGYAVLNFAARTIQKMVRARRQRIEEARLAAKNKRKGKKGGKKKK